MTEAGRVAGGLGDEVGRVDGARRVDGAQRVDRARRDDGVGRVAGGGPSRTVAVLLDDAGMATAEYAVATLAAVGFAGLLFAVLRSGEVQEMLTELVRRALTTI